MSGEPAPGRIVAIVPAAGRSSRFGSMKLLADVGGQTLIDRTLTTLLDAGVDPILLVTAAHVALTAAVRTLDLRIVRLSNPDPERGMFSTLQVGLLHVARHVAADAVLILPADMPFVRSATVATVAAHCARTGSPVAAAYRERRGHPLALPAALLPGLVQANPTGSLRDALASLGGAVTSLDIDDPGVLRDVDVPADLP